MPRENRKVRFNDDNKSKIYIRPETYDKGTHQTLNSGKSNNTTVTLDTHYKTQVDNMIKNLSIMFPEEALEEKLQSLKDIAEKSYIVADEIYSAHDAETWGNGFIVSDALVASDENLFRASMRDLKKMTQQKKRNWNQIDLTDIALKHIFETITQKEINYRYSRIKECLYYCAQGSFQTAKANYPPYERHISM